MRCVRASLTMSFHTPLIFIEPLNIIISDSDSPILQQFPPDLKISSFIVGRTGLIFLRKLGAQVWRRPFDPIVPNFLHRLQFRYELRRSASSNRL